MSLCVSLDSHHSVTKRSRPTFARIDAAAIGIFLLGEDPFHNNGQIILGKHNTHSAIDYTKERFEWRKDEQGRKRPYIWANKWILINNLHVHSKALHTGLSKSLQS